MLAAFLRFYTLSYVPPSPSLDEVSIGYNAYSILKTGADEYGTKFPLLLRAYDDWRPGLYVYFVIPFIAVFGLTVTAVRLPSVFLSLLTVVMTYVLVKELLKQKNSPVPAVTAAFLAISPWHIYLSRLGHEVNLGLTLVIAGMWFLVRFLNDPVKKYSLIASSILFALSLSSYQSQKIVVPVLLLSAAILFFKELVRSRYIFLFSIALGILFSIPILLASVGSQALVRFHATSAFSDPTVAEANNKLFVLAKMRGDIIGQILFYPATVPIKIFLGNYFSHFRPGWLFFGSMFESHKVPGMGLLYWWEMISIPIGIWVFAKSSVRKNLKIFVFIWFLSSPLPAAITTQAPHAMRSYTFLPLWQLFSATGIVAMMFFLRKRLYRIAAAGIFCLVLIISIWTLGKQYFQVFPTMQSDSFQYPLSRAIPFVAARVQSYDQIIFSNRDALYQSYMFFLFFTKFDPERYRDLGGTVSGGYEETHRIGKFQFRPIVWEKDKRLPHALFIGNSSEFPQGSATVGEFSTLDGKVEIKIIQT